MSGAGAGGLISILDCSICQSMMYSPLTTSCGHTFCKSCIIRVADYDNKCPICRRVVYVGPESGINTVINEIIQTQFPNEYAKRKEEVDKENGQTEDFNVPLFLLGDLILFPGVNLPLHVFEPRYRLMIRRCLEGSRTFGIIPLSATGQLAEVGTCALIENYWHMPDGRMLIATTGTKRFKVTESWTQDNYKVAKVVYIDDRPVSPEEQQEVNALFTEIKTSIVERFGAMQKALEEKFGKMPDDPAMFSFWLPSILPLGMSTKMELLASDSVLYRLHRLKESYTQSNASLCNMF